MSSKNLTINQINEKIYFIRGQKVILDRDLAQLYEVPTKRLKEQVRRNIERFPKDFMFELNLIEAEQLTSRSQIATLKKGQNVKYRPFAFTEQGVAMLSSVLNSKRAIAVNIEIMRAFVKLRQILASNKELAERLTELEKKYDSQFNAVFTAIRQLMSEPDPKKGKLGF